MFVVEGARTLICEKNINILFIKTIVKRYKNKSEI